MRNPYDVIVEPLITEKVMEVLNKQNTYAFQVAMSANKLEVKSAVEKAFNVKVKSVRTLVVKGKAKRYKFARGTRPDWKKAIVTLHEGHRIDIV